jgi:acyl dehydratase
MSAEAARVGDVLPVAAIEISQALIDAYARLSGDFNTVHVDPRAGEAAGFGGTIAHGCIPVEPVFGAIRAWLGADQLPPGATLRLRYRAPARPGDRIRAHAHVAALDDATGTRRATVAFACRNQHDATVIDGECELALPDTPTDGGSRP